MKITTEGNKHLGAALGSNDHREQFVKDKVAEWVKEIECLSSFALTVPHASYSAFVHGIRHKWTYVMRTIEGISDLLLPLEKVIREKLIPALCGKVVNDLERKLLALPPRLGGMGIINPSDASQFEYESSCKLTDQQQQFIVDQVDNGEIDVNALTKAKLKIKESRAEKQLEVLEEILQSVDSSQKRLIECTIEKGASNWLNCLPLKSEGYSLNKQEFKDSIKLRYGWQLEGLPSTCACGQSFSVSHASSCKLGGFIHMRHNEVRDITAKFLDEVCYDVKVEPPLIPLTTEHFRLGTANRSEDARLDISARGFWNRGQRAFFDVRVFDSAAPRLLHKSLKSIHQSHEQEKRRAYNQRVIKVEHGSFTPLVFSTVGGQSYECGRFYNRLSTLLSEKRGEHKSQTTAYIRCKINFSLLRSALVCLRGTRSLRNTEINSSSDLVNTMAGVN